MLVTELCPGLAVNSVDPSCPYVAVTADRDIQEVISRGLAHNNLVFSHSDPSRSVPWEVDHYGHHGSYVGSLALWLWGDVRAFICLVLSPSAGSGWRRCWVPLLKAIVPAGDTSPAAAVAAQFLLQLLPPLDPSDPGK